jgi:hypothetical protein
VEVDGRRCQGGTEPVGRRRVHAGSAVKLK